MLHQYYEKDKLELGLDEVGRGCLLGPIVVAGVIWSNNEPINDLQYDIVDSKKCSDVKRKYLKDYIESFSISHSHQFIYESDIDSMNVLQATMKGMHLCIDSILTNINIDTILVDGGYFPYYTEKESFEVIPHVCIHQGDNLYKSIAAASILAKEIRDTYIYELVQKHPELKKYDIENNKGYGTKKHIEAIKEYGITPWHRKTFGICKQYI
jgi:ribonuclease HII